MTLLLRRGWVGTLPAGSGSFTIPTVPTSSTAVKVALNPNWTSGPTGKDPYRQWSRTVLDGLAYYANGYDQPWSFNPAAPSAFRDLGGASPTTFAVTDAAGGSAHAAGTVLRYKLVFGNSTTGKKTAPQTSTISGELVTYVQYTMAATRDSYITWTDPGGEYDKAYIYRALQDDDGFHFVASVTASTAAYTDAKSDTTIRSEDLIVERYRLTAPPIFEAVASHLNKLWGWTSESSLLKFSQTARADSERVQEDFPDENFIPIGPEDGLGGIRAMLPHYSSAFLFKRRGCYELAGSSLATFESRRVYSDRGVLHHTCMAAQEGVVFLLDEDGLYLWTPGAEPVVAGAKPGVSESPIRSIWDRMNLAARKKFSVHVRPELRVVECYVALDSEPVPNTRVVYDYVANQFVSIDTLVWATCAGTLEDAQGTPHSVRVDDLGWLWENDYNQSEGVASGDVTGTVTSGSATLLTCSAAAFAATALAGPTGAPFERYSSAGVVLDQNRAYTASGTELTPLYYSSESVSAGNTVAVGVIPAVFTLPKLTWNDPRRKDVQQVIFGHDNGVSGSFKVETAVDEGSYAAKTPEPSLSSRVQSIVTCYDHAATWSLQVSQRYANLGFSFRAAWIYYRLGLDRSV